MSKKAKQRRNDTRDEPSFTGVSIDDTELTVVDTQKRSTVGAGGSAEKKHLSPQRTSSVYLLGTAQHFATVAELVHLISIYLNTRDALSMSSVNTRWRRAVLWADHGDQVKSMWDAKLMEDRKKNIWSKDDRNCSICSTFSCVVCLAIQLIIIALWLSPNRWGDPYEAEGLLVVFIAVMAVNGLLLILQGVLVASSFRPLFRWFIFYALACLIHIAFVAATMFAGDLYQIAHSTTESEASWFPMNPSIPPGDHDPTGETTLQLGLTDAYPWHTDVVNSYEMPVALVQITDPRGWKRLDDDYTVQSAPWVRAALWQHRGPWKNSGANTTLPLGCVYPTLAQRYNNGHSSEPLQEITPMSRKPNSLIYTGINSWWFGGKEYMDSWNWDAKGSPRPAKVAAHFRSQYPHVPLISGVGPGERPLPDWFTHADDADAFLGLCLLFVILPYVLLAVHTVWYSCCYPGYIEHALKEGRVGRNLFRQNLQSWMKNRRK